MGTFYSKNKNDAEEQFVSKFRSPEHVKKLSFDPRSPTDEIARTPILVENSSILDSPNAEGTLEANLETTPKSRLLRTPLGALNANKKPNLSQKVLGRFAKKYDLAKDDSEFGEQNAENDLPDEKFKMPNGEIGDPSRLLR